MQDAGISKKTNWNWKILSFNFSSKKLINNEIRYYKTNST